MSFIKLIYFFSLMMTSATFLYAHSCDRECIPGATKSCFFNFKIETLLTMSKSCGRCPYAKSDCFEKGCITAGGLKRLVTVVNKQIPGPTPVVCEGDQVIVNVQNSMLNGKGVTIHWHGQFQRETPFMDGVPMITQCPIPLMNTMQYNFTAHPSGTHWWHSHVGLQRADGIFGGLIVRKITENNKHHYRYDIDDIKHRIILIDWTDITASERYLGMRSEYNGILINGNGNIKSFERTLSTPLSEYEVEKGLKYRFRVINGAAGHCGMRVSIDQHKLTLISSDGRDFEPETVDAFNIFNGERYDFVLNANQPNDAYWIRVQGLQSCSKLSQKAILRYSLVDLTKEPNSTATPITSILNAYHYEAAVERPIYVNEYKALKNEKYEPYRIKETPDQTLYFELGFSKSYNGESFPQINNLSWEFPDRPLLFEPKGFNQSNFCTSPKYSETRTPIHCVNRIKIKKDELIEMILFNSYPNDTLSYNSYSSHPFHLHGQYYAVVAQKWLNKSISLAEMKNIYESEKIERNFDRPPLKDTLLVTGGGYTVLRFRATNPGFWLFHCHIAFHFEAGMGLVFDVGEPSQWNGPPKTFPRCGSYKPYENNTSSANIIPTSLLVTLFSTLCWLFMN